jgi:hypothetical protein
MVQLPLSLFMFWIFANDEDAALAPDDAALGAAFANGWRYFHEISPCILPFQAQPKF